MMEQLRKQEQTMSGVHIACIDDDEDLLVFLQMLLESQGYQVSTYVSGVQFLCAVEQDPDLFDLILCDYMLPDGDGFRIYTQSRKVGVICPFLMLTAYSDFDVAVQSIKAGISDYLLKPIKEELFLSKVSSYVRYRTLEEEVMLNRLGNRVVAYSQEMKDILRRLSRVAKSRASILLTGESGTGKEVLSRMLHTISPRSQEGSFVAINVSAIPESLFEAEFFGYCKGAFTGAVRDHVGYARMADQGTLFLDELGEMSLSSQAKLLRLLEEKKVQSLGGRTIDHVDFRVISATNRDLLQRIEQGDFRDDLYYRLAVVTIRIPPLRERPEDIMPLARHLLRELATEEGMDILDFTPEAQEMLLAYAWPGNVRELKNRVYEAMLASGERWIGASHLNLPKIGQKTEALTLAYTQAKTDFERQYITRLLKITRGNINKIAEISGLSRKAVYDLMKRHAIDPERFRAYA